MPNIQSLQQFDPKAARRLYARAVFERSMEDATRVISSALRDGARPLEIYQEVIVPTQVEIGERWHVGEMSISEEHIATQISIEQMNRLRGLIKPKPALHKKVIVGALNGDPHWLGARIVADHFYQDGWDVDFLGASPPLGDLMDYIEKTEPDLLVLSLTASEDLQVVSQLQTKLSRLRQAPKLILGGRMFITNDKASLPKGVQTPPITSDPRKAIQLGRKLCGIGNSDAALQQLLQSLGERIQAERKRRKLSQKELADIAEIDRAYVSAIEGGKQNFSMSVLFKISTALEVSIEELLCSVS